MPSKNLKKSLPIVGAFGSLKETKKRLSLLKHFDESKLSRAIREMSYNVLHGNIKLTDEQKKKLRRYRKILRELADPKTKKSKFRKLVTQKGSGIPLIPLLVPIVSAALSAMI